MLGLSSINSVPVTLVKAKKEMVSIEGSDAIVRSPPTDTKSGMVNVCSNERAVRFNNPAVARAGKLMVTRDDIVLIPRPPGRVEMRGNSRASKDASPPTCIPDKGAVNLGYPGKVGQQEIFHACEFRHTHSLEQGDGGNGEVRGVDQVWEEQVLQGQQAGELGRIIGGPGDSRHK